jgi:hypothetical protein
VKVYIGPHVGRWVSYVHDRYMGKKHGYYTDWPETQTRFENFVEKLEDVLQWIYNHSINLYLDRKERNIKIRIDRYDTWSMDDTLAHIVVPMLKQLKETKHGAPAVEFKDVPEELIPPDAEAVKKLYMENGETDDNYYKRWDWVLDEMIWAFEQKRRDHWHDDYYGSYIEDKKSGPLCGRFEWINRDGMNKHQKRMSNGFRLFGKYYENLWD